MRRLMFILLLNAALLAGGAALASPGEADVMISDGRLSVSARDAAIGNIISEISQQAGFELDINPEVSQKTVTTSFSDLDIQKGIERLLSLIRHKDYFIYYGTDGSISRLEVHGAEEKAGPAVQRPRTFPPGTVQPVQPNNRRRMPPRPQIQQAPPVPNRMNTPPGRQQFTPNITDVPPPVTDMPPMPINPEEEPVPPDFPMDDVPEDMPPPPLEPDAEDSSPYIPPARMPSYIPPRQ